MPHIYCILDLAININTNLRLADQRNLKTKHSESTIITIATNVLTVTDGIHTIATEFGGATEDINTISGMADGEVSLLSSEVGASDPVFKHGVDNLLCVGNTDITLSTKTYLVEARGHNGSIIITPIYVG